MGVSGPGLGFGSVGVRPYSLVISLVAEVSQVIRELGITAYLECVESERELESVSTKRPLAILCSVV